MKWAKGGKRRKEKKERIREKIDEKEDRRGRRIEE